MNSTSQRELVGHCGVDSGQIMLTDPCYVHKFVEEPMFDATLKEPYPYSYNGACSATCSERMFGELDNGSGVVITSGWGDGLYPVYVTRSSDGRIASATIVFIEEDGTDRSGW